MSIPDNVRPDPTSDEGQPATEAPSEDRLTRRSIRSFVVRNGRTTGAQTDALQRLLPKFGLKFTDTPIDLSKAFDRTAPTWMEIGFGKIGQPLRVALLGKMSGPGIDVVMAVIGKDETMLRIANAITANS